MAAEKATETQNLNWNRNWNWEWHGTGRRGLTFRYENQRIPIPSPKPETKSESVPCHAPCTPHFPCDGNASIYAIRYKCRCRSRCKGSRYKSEWLADCCYRCWLNICVCGVNYSPGRTEPSRFSDCLFAWLLARTWIELGVRWSKVEWSGVEWKGEDLALTIALPAV